MSNIADMLKILQDPAASPEKEYIRNLLKDSLDANGKVVAVKPDDARTIIPDSVKFVFTDGSHADIVVPMTADQTITIKEGVTFVVYFNFYIQHDVVPRIQVTNEITKLGISVEKETTNLGSWAPRLEMYSAKCSDHEAPSGFMGRGSYTLKSVIFDDSEKVHTQWSCSVKIEKDFK